MNNSSSSQCCEKLLGKKPCRMLSVLRSCCQILSIAVKICFSIYFHCGINLDRWDESCSNQTQLSIYYELLKIKAKNCNTFGEFKIKCFSIKPEGVKSSVLMQNSRSFQMTAITLNCRMFAITIFITKPSTHHGEILKSWDFEIHYKFT